MVRNVRQMYTKKTSGTSYTRPKEPMASAYKHTMTNMCNTVVPAPLYHPSNTNCILYYKKQPAINNMQINPTSLQPSKKTSKTCLTTTIVK